MICLNAFASDYYVDYASGADVNAGNNATAPWQHSPGDPAATAVVAATALAAGDTIHFKGGVAYVFTGSTGIRLNWNGAPSNPITYDGNSSGSWGTGRATFTDNFGSNSLSAFSSPGNASYLSFKNLDVGAMGGAASPPPDAGVPVAPKFGGGITFNGAATGVTIDSCAFHDLGYTFNQRPMSAASIASAGVAFRDCTDLAITGCTFSRTAVGIEMTGSIALTNLTIANCTFSDPIVWSINQPAGASSANLSIFGCTEIDSGLFNRNAWAGYGESPRVTVQAAAESSTVTFSVSAIAIPSPTFQWLKNGAAIPGATNSYFTLSPVALADSGVYTVAATNPAGVTVSNEEVLIVTASTSPPANNSAPVIATQPASATVAPFSTATFSVVASGGAPLSYQWRRNGVAFAGWTNSTLTLDGVSANDTGAYSVVVTNSAGSVTSNSATLSIGTSAPPPPVTSGAPVITTQPASVTVAPFTTATFSVAASGSAPLTYQWQRNGVAFSGWTGSTLTLVGVSSNDAGAYSVIVTNSAGSVTSNSATLSIGTSAPPPPPVTNGAPVITTQPASVTVAPFDTAIFSVAATGGAPLTYQWRRNGFAFSGWTNATLVLVGVSANDIGAYSVVVTNAAGSVTSDPATLFVGSSTPTNLAPIITTQPLSQTVARLGTATFFVKASGSPTPTYQWTRNGVPIAGWTAAALVLVGVSSNDNGTYAAIVTNSAGTATSTSATLTVLDVTTAASTMMSNTLADAQSDAAASGLPSGTGDSRLTNFSVRSRVNPDNGALIVGFVVSGGTDKPLLIRGIGPTLGDFGVTGAMVDPVLSVYSGATLLAKNDDWSSSTEAAAIAHTSTRLGAFALPNASLDAALLTTIAPGAYTAQSSAFETSPDGITMVELYDAAPTNAARLANVSVRTFVRAGNSPFIGFVVSGTTPKKLLVRAIGPGLAAFGVAQTLADPQLEIFDASASVQKNDDWNGTAELTAASASVGAFPLRDPASKDAAVIFTAAPGAYTVAVTGANNASGTVLVEVYELP